MELKKIQYFLRIVEKGSLSKAAESLYLTQPTLSRFLAKLEEEAGAKLFLRGRDNSLTLTESGKLYLEAAKKIDALWNGLQADLLNSRQGNETQEILLGIDADSLYPFVSACADQVSARFPHVTVRILRYGAFTIQQYVADGTLDVGLTAYEDEDDRLLYIRTRRAEVNLIVSWSNPMSARSCDGSRISLAELEQQLPFMLIREATILRQLEDRYMEAMGYEPMVKRTYNQHRSAIDVISTSPDLIGFCPGNYLSERVAYLALDPPFFYKCGVCIRRDTEQTAAARFLIDLLKKQPATNTLD